LPNATSNPHLLAAQLVSQTLMRCGGWRIGSTNGAGDSF
jgi:hypothetical protein